MDAELEPLDHDAFQLDHRIISPEAMSPQAMSPQAISQGAMSPGLVNRQAWLDSAPAQLARGAGLILPPPPRPRDLEPSSPAGLERPLSLLERLERSEWSGAYRDGSLQGVSAHGTRPGAVPAPALAELPSTDPFAGFIVPPPSFAQRSAAVVVIALAVVGVFALAALVVWWLTNAA